MLIAGALEGLSNSTESGHFKRNGPAVAGRWFEPASDAKCLQTNKELKPFGQIDNVDKVNFVKFNNFKMKKDMCLTDFM